MTPAEKERLDGANNLYAVYRILFLMQMMHRECEYLKGRPCKSSLKAALANGIRNYQRVADALKHELPNSYDAIMKEVNGSEEKTSALANIFDRLSHIDEQHVLEIEEKILENIKVKETEDEPQAQDR